MGFIETVVDSLGAAALLGMATFFGRNLITARLARAVGYEYDKKFEELKGEIRKGEDEIKVLREGALAGLVGRQAVRDKRRIEAVDDLWAAFNALNPARPSALMLACLDFERVSALAAEDPAYRHLADLATGLEPKALFAVSGWKARPHVSEMAWALYSAYAAIIGLAIAQMMMIKHGIASRGLINYEPHAALLTAVLPHHADAIAAAPRDGGSKYIEEIEAAFLAELSRVLEAKKEDAEAVRRAGEIISLAANASLTANTVAGKAGPSRTATPSA